MNVFKPAFLLLFPLFLFPAYAELIAYYSFDEQVAGNYLDITGKGNTAYSISGVSMASGVFGKAASFNLGSRLRIDDSSSLDGATGSGQPRSLSVWIETSLYSNRVVTEKGVGDHFVLQTLDRASPPVKVHWRVTGASANSGVTGFANPVGAPGWHLVVGIYDGSVQHLYVDGQLQGSRALSASPDNNEPLYVGARYNGTAYFVGKLDDLAVYSHSLTEEERAALWNGGLGQTVRSVFLIPEPASIFLLIVLAGSHLSFRRPL